MSDPVAIEADKNLQVLINDLRPYAEKTVGSLRIDMADVKSILHLYDGRQMLIPHSVAWKRPPSVQYHIESEQADTERLAACKARRKRYGQNSCEERDGSCAECEDDAARKVETPESMQRRLRFFEAEHERLWRLANLSAWRQQHQEGDDVVYHTNDLDIVATFVGYDEGWCVIRFKDNTTTTVRPSHITSQEKNDDRIARR